MEIRCNCLRCDWMRTERRPSFATIADWRRISGQKRLVVHCTFGVSRYRKHTCRFIMVISSTLSNNKSVMQSKSRGSDTDIVF